MRAALPGWLVAHVVVLLALGAAWWYRDGLETSLASPEAHGLFVWDSAWYRDIAEHGYGHLPAEAVRFFPLLPMASATVAGLTGAPVGAALIAVCWLAALGYGALLFDLARTETGDELVARRAAWFAQLFPGASVLVLGYTEALAGLLAVGYFRLLRAGQWELLIPLGIAGGLTRPTGVLLALAGLAGLGDRRAGLPVRLVGAAAPAVGTGALLAWAGVRYGDPLLPYRVQTAGTLRGGVAANPLPHLFHTSGAGPPWPVNLVLLVAALALLVVCVRRLPAPYALWSAALIAAAVTAGGLHSLARYLAAAFPLVLAASLLSRRRRAFVAALAVCLPLFAYLSFIGFSRHYVP